MLTPLLTLATAYSFFSATDKALTLAGVKNPYYLLHAAHNAVVVYLTAPEVYTVFTDLHGLDAYQPNYTAAALVAALHAYHVTSYWRKFRLDDWLHHVLMICVALPVGVAFPSSVFLGFSLFFSTGLPGGIDYGLLFLVRNGLLHPVSEKRVNRFLNVWIRSPGCVAHAALTAAAVGSAHEESWKKVILLLPALLMYWNGQYFMDQVVSDYAVRAKKEKEEMPAMGHLGAAVP